MPKKDHSQILHTDETVKIAKAAAELGISKIRITGGEPLVKKGVVGLCEEIADIKGIEEVCITTNGTLLPQYAKDLVRAGVTRVNISLDTLNPEKYHYITRLGNLEEALAGIDAALEAGFDKVKINNVLVGGFNDDEIKDFAELTRAKPIEVRFIELMPIGGGIGFDRNNFISTDKVLEELPELESLNKTDGVARIYKLPESAGQIGLIRPVSCEFCGDCNKIRLTADGMVKPCLHSDQEISVKDKSYEEVKILLEKAINSKPEMRGALDAENPSMAGRDMNAIGG